MKVEYKYIHFSKIDNSGGSLGIAQWYSPWRQYCFFPAAQCVFNVGCIEDIKLYRST